MKKLFILGLVIFFIFSYSALAFGHHVPGNNLYLEVAYNLPFNTDNADSGLSVGLLYPFWGVFRFSGDMEFNLTNKSNNSAPPDLCGGVGINIPLGGFRFFTDFQRGYDLSSSGITDYCSIMKTGIKFVMNERCSIEGYIKDLDNFNSKYSIPGEKIKYMGFGLAYKL